MKPKMPYILLAILAIGMFILIALTNNLIKDSFVTEKSKIQQEEVSQSDLISMEAEQPSLPFKKMPGITVIKPPTQEKVNPMQKEKTTKAILTQKTVVSDTYRPPAAWEEKDDFSESFPGITKIGKIPTEKESKEMNSRGIIIY